MLPHDLCFKTANRLVIGNDLAVQVCEADAIRVHQNKRSDTGTHQSIRRMSSHAAEAEYRHLCVRKTLHSRRAEQQLGAGKFVQHAPPPHRRTAATV